MNNFTFNNPQEVVEHLNKLQEQHFFPEPQFHSFRLGDVIGRSIWNAIHVRPKDEHLHEFIVNAMLWTLGENWFNEQNKKPLEERHIIMRWLHARYIFLTEAMSRGTKIGDYIQTTGEVRELVSLASDMYYLQLVRELPTPLLERLKNYDGFQGARYEIAVAASLVRSGFEIEWKGHSKGQKIHEFDAIQKYSKETIAIEAKSRRRKGTLHEHGDLPSFDEIKIDIFSLFNKAMMQNPNDKPFGVYIDINLPRPKHFQGINRDWKEIYFEKLQLEGASIFGETPPTFVAITNSAWHYDKDNLTSAGEFYLTVPTSPKVKFPFKNEITLQAIMRSLTKFSQIPKDDLNW
jgi:hypothetical protein